MSILGYLDAGSGSMILQAILGGAAGFLVAFKMFGRRVKSFIFFWRKPEIEPDAEHTDTHADAEPAPAAAPSTPVAPKAAPVESKH